LLNYIGTAFILYLIDPAYLLLSKPDLYLLL
jgi:hypothetical protein